MTLPALISLEECSDWSKTVEPFIPQLYDLPKRLLETLQTGGSLLDVYKTTNPLISGFAFSVFLGAVFLVAAEVNRNYSQVDRFWSVLPTFYIAHFDLWARLTGVPHQRIDLALLFSTLWSVSVTGVHHFVTWELTVRFELGTTDLQLLAQGRLREGIRRLQMVCQNSTIGIASP
jgi:hypothetical protein